MVARAPLWLDQEAAREALSFDLCDALCDAPARAGCQGWMCRVLIESVVSDRARHAHERGGTHRSTSEAHAHTREHPMPGHPGAGGGGWIVGAWVSQDLKERSGLDRRCGAPELDTRRAHMLLLK